MQKCNTSQHSRIALESHELKKVREYLQEMNENSKQMKASMDMLIAEDKQNKSAIQSLNARISFTQEQLQKLTTSYNEYRKKIEETLKQLDING